MRTARSGPSRSSASTSWTASPGSSPSGSRTAGACPLAQTSSTIPLDLVNNIVRRPYADRLRLIIGELGAGLAGRPDDLSEVLRRAHPGLRETNQTLRILARQTRTIERVIVDARHGGRRAGAAAARRVALRARGGRDRRGRGHSQRRPGRLVRPAPGLPGRARSLHGPARAARHGPAARAAEPARRRRRPRHVPHAPAAVRGCRRPGRQEPGPGVGGGQPRRPRDDRRPQGAAPVRQGGAGPRQAAAPAARVHRRPRARRGARSARGRHGPAGAGQDPHLGRGRLHRHGGDLGLLLLADALHQRARRPRPRAAAERVRQPVLRLLQPPRGPGGRVRPVPAVARAEPARHQPARPRRDRSVRRRLSSRRRRAGPGREPVLDYLLGQ